MRLSSLHILVLKKSGKPIQMNLFLGDECEPGLKGPFHRILQAEDTIDLIEGIEASFCYSDEKRADLIDLTCEWDVEKAYDKFVTQLNRCGMNNISELILLINTEMTGGDRDYEWLRYDFVKHTVKRGTAKGINKGHLKTGKALPTVEEIIGDLTSHSKTLREIACAENEFDADDEDFDDEDFDDEDFDDEEL